MSISEHSNGLASTIDFKYNRIKQDKRLISHHFPLHLPQQTKHHSSEPRYAALLWFSINFQWVFSIQLVGGGGRESTKLFGVLNQPWLVLRNKPSQQIKHMQACLNRWREIWQWKRLFRRK